MKQNSEYSFSSKWCDPRAMAVALGRWVIGILFLFFGIGKFTMGVGIFAKGMAQPFEKTWLPPILLNTFGHVLPFCEVILGALLILGLFRNATLFVTGLLLIVLTFGQVLLGQAQVVFFNTIYTFLVAALLFLADYDRWVIFPRRQINKSPPSA